jgi:2,4-diaminopentanoate dehydrogenase
VLEHPELELAGCWVHSEAKSGKDVGEIVGTTPLGVTATDSVDDILALDADAVVYAPLLPNVDEVAALLRSGKNVVTPVGWFYPGEREAAPLEVAAQAGNATLHGAGIGPGAATELFPLLFSVMSTGVTFVRSEEFSDLRTYGASDVLRYVMGFGGTPDNALTGPMQKLLDGGLTQSVRLCIDQLGFAAEPEIRASQEVAVASAPIDSPIGVIERGQVAGRRFHWEALVGRYGGRPDHGELANRSGKPRSAMVVRAGRGTLRNRSPREPGRLCHGQGLAAGKCRSRPEKQPWRRRDRGALRES